MGAVLAANGLGPEGIEQLHLHEGQLSIRLSDGRRQQVAELFAVWSAPAAVPRLSREQSFKRVDVDARGLTLRGLAGRFEARAFRIVDEVTGHDLDARIEVDLRRQVLRVIVARRRREFDADPVPCA
jgi:hypothetical protein